MDIRHLDYFLETARLKSFTRAAESLHFTQPAISKAIRQLEEELRATLFDRIGNLMYYLCIFYRKKGVY